MEHCCSQGGSRLFCCDITAKSRIGDILWRMDKFVLFVLDLIVWRETWWEKRERGHMFGARRRAFEPPLHY
jgi:hypothetical protein